MQMSKIVRPETGREDVQADGLVGVPGVEPGTSSLSGTRSNQLSYTPGCVGGGSGIRTRDFQLAKLALCQLSYAPLRRHRPVSSGILPVRSFPPEPEAARQVDNLCPVVCFIGALCGPSPSEERNDCPYPPPGIASFGRILLRKEVIQPLVPQRLPCYDFIPVTNRTLDVYPPCGSNQRLWVQSAPMM